MLSVGENTIKITVNDGWYCGALKWLDEIRTYGEQSAVCGEIRYGKQRIITDESWTARESYIKESGIYDGEKIDYTRELKNLEVCEIVYEKTRLVPQISKAVKDDDRLPVKQVIKTPCGDTVYDFGPNFAGVVQITPKNFSGTLTLKFAEILVNGEFYTDNLREAKATDIFTVSGEKTIVPEFTYHGFRYLKIEEAVLDKDSVTGAENGSFEIARKLLFNNAYPGWLYEVDMGATTIWERWNALMKDGTPNFDGMNSYNHYAYGSVVEFIYRKIAGVERKSDGY